MTDEPREALRRLEDRLTQASDAAERLLAEAARSAREHGYSAGDRPPDSGWQMPRTDDESDVRGPAVEFEMLQAAVGLVRDLIPPDVLARLAAAVRELLLALRALLDFYLERLERTRSEPERVRDIPID